MVGGHLIASQTGMPLRLNPTLQDLRKNRLPRPKAVVNAPHSRRSARFADAQHSRSVWSARVFSTAFPPTNQKLLTFRHNPFPTLCMT